MKSSGLFRLGRDAEVRFIPSGEAVVELALAFNHGKKGEDGNRPSQWIKASFWGKRAEAVAPYLLKGSQVVAHLADLHIETFEGKNGHTSWEISPYVVHGLDWETITTIYLLSEQTLSDR